MALIVAAEMTELMPGAGPPPTRIASLPDANPDANPDVNPEVNPEVNMDADITEMLLLEVEYWVKTVV
jgi:hypothetical protein